jgi:hypothetical protein
MTWLFASKKWSSPESPLNVFTHDKFNNNNITWCAINLQTPESKLNLLRDHQHSPRIRKRL